MVLTNRSVFFPVLLLFLQVFPHLRPHEVTAPPNAEHTLVKFGQTSKNARRSFLALPLLPVASATCVGTRVSSRLSCKYGGTLMSVSSLLRAMLSIFLNSSKRRSSAWRVCLVCVRARVLAGCGC